MLRLNSDLIMKSIEDAHQMLVKLVHRRMGSEEKNENPGNAPSEDMPEENKTSFNETA